MSRICPVCGRSHNLCVENSITGEIIKEIDKCKDCLMSGCFINHPKTQIQFQVSDEMD